MKIRICFFCLILVTASVTKTCSQNSNLVDSINFKLGLISNNDHKIDFLIETISHTKITSINDSLLNLLFNLSFNEKNCLGLSKYYFFRGQQFKKRNSYDKSNVFFTQAIPYAIQCNNDDFLAEIYNEIGVNYRRIDEYHKAIEFHLLSLKAAERCNNNLILAKTLNGLGNCYTSLSNYPKAIDYFNKALQLQKLNQNQLGIAINLNNLGEVFEKKNDLNQALDYYIQSLKVNQQMQNEKGIAISYNCIGNIYKSQNNYKRAIEHYNKALEIDKKLQDKYYIAISHTNLGEAYCGKNQFNLAGFHFSEAMRIAIELDLKSIIQRNYENFSILYQKTGEYRLALSNYKSAVIYKDSIFNIEKTATISKMQEIFDKQKNEERIKLLEIEKYNNRKNEQNNIILLILVFVIILVATISGLIYKQNRTKTKANKLLQDKNLAIEKVNIELKDEIANRKSIQEQLQKSLNEKEILITEIHHRVKNNLAIVSGLLQLQLFKAGNKETQISLEDACNRILSMALIHESMYQSHSDGLIDCKSYLNELVKRLVGTKKNITLNTKFENILIDLHTAITFGLLVTELISNAVKHAFPEPANGKLYIHLIDIDNELSFIIADNGIGLPPNFDLYKQNTLGMELIRNFVKQLKAKIEIQKGTGTTILIKFVPKKKSIYHEDRINS